MRILVILASLLIVISAHAAPSLSNDEPPIPVPDKSVLGRIDQVRQSVREKASSLVSASLGFIGVPYRRGGESAETGFDCSGFVRAVYEQTLGLVLPRRAAEQAAAMEAVTRAELQPGDLVFFNTMRRAFSHVGIYVGDGKFIHSPKPGAEVRVESMGVSYWSRRFDGARRVLDESASVASERTQKMFEKLTSHVESDRNAVTTLRTVAGTALP
jgi:cell wall-associated NlpC family hydrolase